MANTDKQGEPASELPTTMADGTTTTTTPATEGAAAAAPASDIQHPRTTPDAPAATQPTEVAGVDEYEKKLEALTAPQAAPDLPPEPTPAPGQEPAPEPTPATQPEPTAPPEPEPDEGKIPDRIRLGGMSEKSRAKIVAATMLAKAEGIEFDAAYARLNAAAPPSQEPPPPGEAPRDLAAIQGDIAAQKQEVRRARREMDVDAEFAAEDRMEALLAEQDAAMRAEQERADAEKAGFEAAVDEQEAQARVYYPVMADPGHAIHEVAKRIWATMDQQDNPLLSTPAAIKTVYTMAANELGIAPQDPAASPPPAAAAPAPISHANGVVPPKAAAASSAPAATPRPQAVQQSAVRRPTPAGTPAPGSARTTPVEPATTTPGIGKIRTAADYERLTAGLA